MSILVTQQLTVTIGNKLLCQDVNLTIAPGDCWGLLGPNGCGKTTLLHTLAGMLPQYQGDIFLLGKNIRQLSLRDLAKQRALLLQDQPTVFSQTVFELCLSSRHPHQRLFFSDEDKAMVNKILMDCELSHLNMQDVMRLSGGEQQRLKLAAMLIQAPQLFLLDEPTNHLDVRHQHALLKYFHLKPGTAMIMALHDINIAQHYCNKMLLIFENGRTLQGDTHDILSASNLKKLYRQDFLAIEQQQQKYWFPTLTTVETT